MLALREEESFGRKSVICNYLEPIDINTSMLDESKDCEDPEMSDESADEMDATQTLELNASSCSQLTNIHEDDDC